MIKVARALIMMGARHKFAGRQSELDCQHNELEGLPLGEGHVIDPFSQSTRFIFENCGPILLAQPERVQRHQ